LARFLIRDRRPQVRSFVCPVTQCDSLKYSGCEAENAKFTSYHSGRGRILARFRCACGKKLILGVLSGGIEVTNKNYQDFYPKPELLIDD